MVCLVADQIVLSSTDAVEAYSLTAFMPFLQPSLFLYISLLAIVSLFGAIRTK